MGNRLYYDPQQALKYHAAYFYNRDFEVFEYFPKQLEAIKILTNDVIKFYTFGGGGGGGKTWTGWEWEIWLCIHCPGIRCFIGRNELKRLRQTSLKTFFKVCKKYGIHEGVDFKINHQDNFIGWANGSQIDLLDLRYLPSDPLFERFGSYEYTIGWIEEAGEVDFGAFDVLKTRIGRQYNDKYNIPPKIFLTCNPKKNWLKRLFYDLWASGSLPEKYAFTQSLAKDNPKNDSSYVEGLDDITDKGLRARIRDGDWNYDDNPMRIINDDSISDLFSNPIESDTYNKYITADVARLGSDFFVIGVWYGFVLVEIKVLEKCTQDEAYQAIEALRLLHTIGKSNVICDEEGVGGGIIDFGKYKGFISNSTTIEVSSVKENYGRLGDQVGFRMANRINQKGIKIDCFFEKEQYKEMLINDMEAIETMPLEPNKAMRIISKDKIKKTTGGRSPDFWDMICMREFFELKPMLVKKASSARRANKPYKR